MQDNLTIIMNDYLPLRDVVYQTLEQAILMGDLQPGERLMEIHLANRLGVSRTPIREAIRKLELEGLVVNIPRRGAHVAEITKKDLTDVLEVRCALEELAVELGCDRITEDELKALKNTHEEFCTALAKNDVELAAEKDIELHDIIYKASHNARLVQMITNLRMQMYRYRVEYLKDSSMHETLIKEHQALIACLERKDAESAKQIMRKHIENQASSVSKKAH
ncbi:MAG: GntR family transcriptional regulator [Lachnospiraceae bacterium]|nr:GntR family transcriptional regulator [Lachnospiraceae bacterium]